MSAGQSRHLEGTERQDWWESFREKERGASWERLRRVPDLIRRREWLRDLQEQIERLRTTTKKERLIQLLDKAHEFLRRYTEGIPLLPRVKLNLLDGEDLLRIDFRHAHRGAREAWRLRLDIRYQDDVLRTTIYFNPREGKEITLNVEGDLGQADIERDDYWIHTFLHALASFISREDEERQHPARGEEGLYHRRGGHDRWEDPDRRGTLGRHRIYGDEDEDEDEEPYYFDEEEEDRYCRRHSGGRGELRGGWRDFDRERQRYGGREKEREYWSGQFGRSRGSECRPRLGDYRDYSSGYGEEERPRWSSTSPYRRRRHEQQRGWEGRRRRFESERPSLYEGGPEDFPPEIRERWRQLIRRELLEELREELLAQLREEIKFEVRQRLDKQTEFLDERMKEVRRRVREGIEGRLEEQIHDQAKEIMREMREDIRNDMKKSVKKILKKDFKKNFKKYKKKK